MKISTAIIAFVLVLALIPGFASRAQGTFQNLDFEAANTTPIPSGPGNPDFPFAVYVTNGLPAWSVFYGSNQQSQITYNAIATGSTHVTLVGANDPGGPNCIEGNFGVFIQSGSTATDASIRQSSLVPVLTESILFKGQSGGPMFLSLGGQNISYFSISNGPNYTLYGADVSAFAGQTKQLEFSVPEGPGGNNAWNIDSIVFSPNPVPEPATWALMLSGAGLFALRRWKRKR